MAWNAESGHFWTMSEDEKTRKPKPARARPTPASDDPGLRGQRRRPDGPDKRGRGRKRKRKSGKPKSAPTPVREAMDEPALEPTPLSELPARSFRADDDSEWLVRVTGRATVGHPPGTGAVVTHLSFSRRDSPDVVARETLVPCESLEDLTESELVRMLSRADEPAGSVGNEGRE